MTLREITGATEVTVFMDHRASGKWSQSTHISQSPVKGGDISSAMIFQQISNALSARNDVILGSYLEPAGFNNLKTLVSDHDMSVIGVDPATTALIIRNPWGTTGWQNWQIVFEVSLDTLVTYGDIITIDNAGTLTKPSFSSAIVKGWYQAVQFQNAPSARVGDIVASLNNGTQTQTKIWTDITSAPYTSNYLNPAISAFQAALNRIPDQAGEQYWVDQLASCIVSGLID